MKKETFLISRKKARYERLHASDKKSLPVFLLCALLVKQRQRAKVILHDIAHKL